MNNRSFRMLTFVFMIGVIVGAITSFTISTFGASTLTTWWVRERGVVLRKAPAQILLSRSLTENQRSQLNFNVSHLPVSKTAVGRQTVLTTKKSYVSYMFTAGHAKSVTYLSSTLNQMGTDKILSNRKSTSHYGTVTYLSNRKSTSHYGTVTYRKGEKTLRPEAQKFPKDERAEAAKATTQSFNTRPAVTLRQDVLRLTFPGGAGPPTKTPRTTKPTLAINMRSKGTIFSYPPNSNATRQTFVSLSRNRSVATITTTSRAAAGLRVTAPSKLAALSLSTVDHQALLAQQFKPIMSTEDRIMVIRSLKVLASLLQNANVTYFLYGGTLLGCFRHRGLIPWDDDLDIIANYSQVANLRRALENVPGYKLDLWSKQRYKFYAKDALPIPRKAWLWPFIDIFFFSETDSRIFDISSNSTGKYSYWKKDVFPLVNRPFDGLWLPVPHNEEVVVRQDYDFTRCMSNVYSHKNETYIPGSRRYSVACKQLHAIYPFAFRNASQSPFYEVVKVGDKIIAEYNYI